MSGTHPRCVVAQVLTKGGDFRQEQQGMKPTAGQRLAVAVDVLGDTVVDNCVRPIGRSHGPFKVSGPEIPVKSVFSREA